MSTVSLAPVERDNSADSPPIPVVRPWFELLCNAALLGAATLVLTSYALVAFVHRSDRFQVNFISGIYTTLAARLNDGMLYPDLYDGEHFGGTRYMPLPFVLQAGLARLTTDYLIAGKLLAYSLTGILCIELFLILRRIGCGRCAALALIGLVLTSAAGFLAGTTIRGDLLPVVSLAITSTSRDALALSFSQYGSPLFSLLSVCYTCFLTAGCSSISQHSPQQVFKDQSVFSKRHSVYCCKPARTAHCRGS